jgi:hypothetical protein
VGPLQVTPSVPRPHPAVSVSVTLADWHAPPLLHRKPVTTRVRLPEVAQGLP